MYRVLADLLLWDAALRPISLLRCSLLKFKG